MLVGGHAARPEGALRPASTLGAVLVDELRDATVHAHIGALSTVAIVVSLFGMLLNVAARSIASRTKVVS
jgi:ABC-type phosphate transport system permease subunit